MISRVFSYYILLFFILAWFIPGCTLFTPSPESKIREKILTSHPNTGQINISKMRVVPEGNVMIYSYEMPPGEHLDRFRIGVARFKQSDRFPKEWHIVDTTVYGTSTRPVKEDLLQIAYRTEIAGYSTVYGRVLSDEVVAVEAVQEDGAIVREVITEPFVLLSSDGKGNAFCEIRVIGKNETLLKRITSYFSHCADNETEPSPNLAVRSMLVEASPNLQDLHTIELFRNLEGNYR